jgi:hypothetical protein
VCSKTATVAELEHCGKYCRYCKNFLCTKIADIAKIVPEELQEAYEGQNSRNWKNVPRRAPRSRPVF